MRPRVAAAAATAAALVALLAGCGSTGSTSSASGSSNNAAGTVVTPTGGAAAPAKQGGTVTVGLPAGAIDHLEPTLWYCATSWEIAYATCTPLMTFADSSGPAGG
jgi:hypothetical protein